MKIPEFHPFDVHGLPNLGEIVRMFTWSLTVPENYGRTVVQLVIDRMNFDNAIPIYQHALAVAREDCWLVQVLQERVGNGFLFGTASEDFVWRRQRRLAVTICIPTENKRLTYLHPPHAERVYEGERVLVPARPRGRCLGRIARNHEVYEYPLRPARPAIPVVK